MKFIHVQADNIHPLVPPETLKEACVKEGNWNIGITILKFDGEAPTIPYPLSTPIRKKR